MRKTGERQTSILVREQESGIQSLIEFHEVIDAVNSHPDGFVNHFLAWNEDFECIVLVSIGIHVFERLAQVRRHLAVADDQVSHGSKLWLRLL